MIALIFGMVGAGAAYFTMGPWGGEGASEGSSNARQEQTALRKQLTDTKAVMQKFADKHPDLEKVGEYYDDIEVGAYDEFIKMIQFA